MVLTLYFVKWYGPKGLDMENQMHIKCFNKYLA